MKRWILSLALLTLGFTASAQNDLIDRGELAPEIAAASGEKMEWLPSFNGVIVEGLFRIRFERVPMDQAPKIVFNTKGVSFLVAEIQGRVLPGVCFDGIEYYAFERDSCHDGFYPSMACQVR